MQFINLLQKLSDQKIKYLIVGGIAVNLHGLNRTTQDLDLVVYLENKNVVKFISLMSALGYRPKAPVSPMDFANPEKRKEWAQTKNMIVFSFYHEKDPMKIIDVFIEHPLPFEAAYKRRVNVSLGAIKIPVMSIADLIKLKLKANRLQDLSDIKALKEIAKLKNENGPKKIKKSSKKRI